MELGEFQDSDPQLGDIPDEFRIGIFDLLSQTVNSEKIQAK